MGRHKHYPTKRLYEAAYRSIPKNRLAKNLTQRLRRVTQEKGYKYHSSLFHQFGCSKSELVNYIESLFDKEMRWDNYTILWELDHIKPLCAFDFSDLEQLKLANHYTNLRPLLKKDNVMKNLTDDKKYWIKKCYSPQDKFTKISK